MKDIYAKTNRSFIILVDEWDCLFRESQHDTAAQKQYLDFLRSWLKDKDYVALAYMTGILPIKKYGTHSALNMFTEYSMTDPGELAPFFGFTEQEVQLLCENYDMNFDEARAWYADSIFTAIDLPKRRGRLTQMNFCSVSSRAFVFSINPILST